MLKKHLLKIIAIFLSLSFWLFIFSTSSFESSKMIVLELIPPTGQAIGNNVPAKVELVLKGPRALMRSFWKNFNTLKVLVAGEVEDDGTIIVPITMSPIDIPPGLKLIKIGQDTVGVKLERKIKKMVPLKMQFDGEINKEYRLVQQKLIPNDIMIEGPISEMRKTGKVLVSPVDMATLEGEGDIVVSLEQISAKIRVLNSEKIRFLYSIVPKKANVNITAPVRFLSSLRKIRSSVATAHLELMAVDKTKFSEQKAEIRVIADIPENKSGKMKIELKCELPSGIHLLQIRPRYITVTVK